MSAGVKVGEYTFFLHLDIIYTYKCFLVSAYCDGFLLPKLPNVFAAPLDYKSGGSIFQPKGELMFGEGSCYRGSDPSAFNEIMLWVSKGFELMMKNHCD